MGQSTLHAAWGRARHRKSANGTLKKNASTKAAKKEKRCPECGILVKKLQRHLRIAHGKTASLHKLLKCSYCPALVRADRMQSHARRVHKLDIPKAEIKPATSVSIAKNLNSEAQSVIGNWTICDTRSKSSSQSVPCPVCGRPFPTNKMHPHLNADHPKVDTSRWIFA